MPNCTADTLDFGRLKHRVIEANLEGGGALNADGGLMPACADDRRIGLSAVVAGALHEPRDPDRIAHTLRAWPAVTKASMITLNCVVIR